MIGENVTLAFEDFLSFLPVRKGSQNSQHGIAITG